jgi:hypothetical protein
MTKTRPAAALLAALLLLALVPAGAGAVESARTIELDDQGTRSAEWTSDTFVGVAPDFFLSGTAGEYECGAVMEGNCEYSLMAIRGLSDAEIADGLAQGKALSAIRDTVNVTMGITGYSVPVSDLDIIIWQSNADGDKLSELGRVGDLDTDPSEEWSGSVIATGAQPVQYLLLEVVYFAGAGTYDGYVDIS